MRRRTLNSSLANPMDIELPDVGTGIVTDPFGGDLGKPGGGKATYIDDDCPCYEVETARELYLRRTPGSNNDIAIDVPYKRVVCEGTEGKKTVKIDCETEVAKIIRNAGGI